MRSCLALFISASVLLGQSQTGGRISGTITDTTGAVIQGASVTLTEVSSSLTRTVVTGASGNYSASLPRSGIYRVEMTAPGFGTVTFPTVEVTVTETVVLNPQLPVQGRADSIIVSAIAPMTQGDGPQLGRVVGSHSVNQLPLATRNFTQMLTLSPGVSAPLPDHTTLGGNSLDMSVNGARTTQNAYQIDGVEAHNWGMQTSVRVALPAPETIQELKVNTSLFDAALGSFGGGNIQIVIRSGGNEIHGSAYEYFQNEKLNANNTFLKAVGVARPMLRRNVFGSNLGGPIRRGKVFYFVSYQGSREWNGASSSSLVTNLRIGPLTDDRSEQALVRLPGVSSVDPIAFRVLNARLPGGQYLIPTPQVGEYYSGSSPSRSGEDQFTVNINAHLGSNDSLTGSIFFSNRDSMSAIAPGGSIPGFAADHVSGNRLVSIREVHNFDRGWVNEAQFGVNLIRRDTFPRNPLTDREIGIRRATAADSPGLPLFRINPSPGNLTFGTPTGGPADSQTYTGSAMLSDTLFVSLRRHALRVGGTVRYEMQNLRLHLDARGRLDFDSLSAFVAGRPRISVLGAGIEDRALRTSGFSAFVQDDWRIRPNLTLNLGLRYDLHPPPYDTRGRISTFDPALYRPRLSPTGEPTGPPAGGLVQAGNVIAAYNLPDIPNGSKRLLHSIDPNNFGPRIGLAYSPRSGRLVLRAGYGMFYSPLSGFYLGSSTNLPPGYAVARLDAGLGDTIPMADPFSPLLPSKDRFPTLLSGVDLVNRVFDRNLRTPYVHQYTASIQYQWSENLLFEAAFVGSRGSNLTRTLSINQAALATPEHPVVNSASGKVIRTNTPRNATDRAPYQGVGTGTFGLFQTTGQSSYRGLQASATRRFARGVEFLASYTFAKSLDNTASATVTPLGAEVSNEGLFAVGNLLDPRLNRGLSNFDRRQRLVMTGVWDLLPPVAWRRSPVASALFGNWQVAAVLVAMSGLPIDIVDTRGASLYGVTPDSAGARPNFALNASLRDEPPPGYWFNPYAFARAVVFAGQSIPSSPEGAIAESDGTDFGTVGRNILRGPNQINIDSSMTKRFSWKEGRQLEVRAEFFNLFNRVNLSNPVSNLNAAKTFAPNGEILDAGDFGRINSTSTNPRLMQFLLRFSF